MYSVTTAINSHILDAFYQSFQIYDLSLRICTEYIVLTKESDLRRFLQNTWAHNENAQWLQCLSNRQILDGFYQMSKCTAYTILTKQADPKNLDTKYMSLR